ncbi:chromosomal replication initiator protein DnaA [Acidisphaera sp. L21]|uniref:chromosomal replication initiator protein DnaA n=1 Tax=Acidisphaera sp. L21 TaxID=1641851 RepID=UPI00131BADC1|nr:chromosomal replication initiator protein DnaA [Acidisphaera sp. L21]
MNPDLTAQWTRIRDRMKLEVGEVEYRTWLRQMSLGGLDGDEITIHMPTRFLRDWVRSHYGDKLTALWRAENPAVHRVDLRVGAGSVSAPAIAETLPTEPAPAPAPVPASVARSDDRTDPRAEPRQADLASALDPRFSFDAFVVGKPNEFAYACARRVAEQPASQGFNPLFLYGGVGLGKTHLMHAVGLELSRRDNGRPTSVTYMSAEKFMYRFIAAIRSHSTMDFKDSMRSVDVLMVDDVQFLIGKDSTQEEFFHTFNALVDAGKQIVISSDKSPSDLDVEQRLRTRLGCGMVADLHATTFELRVSILEAKATRAGVDVSRRVLEFLAHKITSNVRELEGALNRLLAHASLFGRPVTLESTQEVLRDVLKAQDRRVTIEEIQKRVAEHYHLRLSEMSSARRARNVARPRQVAMYLAKQLTSRSLPEIGRKFGNRDHTTVMHACSRVAEIMGVDAGFAEDVELLRRMLES